MKPEEMRIKIAEACGWRYMGSTCLKETGWKAWIPPVGAKGRVVPKYCVDLNAMHEAEKFLTDEQYSRFDELVYDLARDGGRMTDYIRAVSATASQRAEAFLKTIGKWEPTETKVGEEVIAIPNKIEEPK